MATFGLAIRCFGKTMERNPYETVGVFFLSVQSNYIMIILVVSPNTAGVLLTQVLFDLISPFNIGGLVNRLQAKDSWYVRGRPTCVSGDWPIISFIIEAFSVWR
jgi:hypothetical protein